MTTTATSQPLREFIDEVGALVGAGGTEQELTERVAQSMRRLLRHDGFIDAALCAPAPDRYVMYPVHVDPEGRFSIASAVWGVGQETPIHDHGTWGVIGIYSGVEDERRYELVDGLPVLVARHEIPRGQVEICCTSDADLHAVSCGSDVPCVGLHVYGNDIGTLPRHSYDADTGETRVFVSAWAEPAARDRGDEVTDTETVR